MNPVWREILFWAMNVVLLAIPFAMVWRLPEGRYREMWWRLLTGIVLLAAGALVMLWWLAPRWLPDSFSLGAYAFAILAALLVIVPVVMILMLPENRLRQAMINTLLWFIGAVSLLLGIIGAVLPVMPTTPFILLTAACWGRASPRFHRWLHQHRFFGPMVRNWEERHAIPRRAKYLAWSMMALSSIGLLWRFPERWYVGAGTALVCLCVGLWMARLPDA